MLSGRGGVAISSASTLVFLGALAAAFELAPGSAQVRRYFFSWHDMRVALLGDPSDGLYSIGRAFLLNIEMFLVAEVLILALALVIAVVRQQRGPVVFPLRLVATVYTDVFRGIPTLLVVYAIGFGVPALGLRGISDQPSAVYGVVALVLSYSAYVAEVYRAGINSVPASQLAAARSLGLPHRSALRFVVLPQAVRTVIPPLLNDFISLQKDTALVAVLGAIEANRAAGIYSATVFNYSGYIVAAALFLLITIPLARFTDRLIARDRARRLAAGL
jgi:polar amino acid transport system permease protein